MTTPGTAGTTGTTPPLGYRLVGGQPDTLASLQNQRVEIRGTFQNDSSSPGAASSASASPMRALRITSIRPVPGDCGAAK
jgi:hypothetical protein